ncbi:hypothetical protein EMPS_01374 [Entomortierella parvispora]|uniref:Rho-GAP domain-containing protein n=1 Tax=Entomortierella parvispora TaxID=205924 RepID=A0A9P3H3G2_9FUNG|nr:hypothetical protein EMPS_01374 [Entomortierella parvispora]
MFRLVNKRLAVNRELESMKQDFNQCSLPIEFVYRIVVACVDEIMERGLNRPFILKNPYSPSVVAAILTLLADPERRDLFSLKCTRIDTVAGVMLAVLKNLREAIVPIEIQEELTSAHGGFSNVSGASTPNSSTQGSNKINTVTSLLNHSSFPAVNRALLMELLNLSLAILNRSSFNRVKPDMLASILGPHIFATQHATILQHTPHQAYSFGWGVSLVNDIKRCSKMFYVLLGGYRREVLGSEEWEYEQSFNSAVPSGFGINSPGPASTSRGQVNKWLGSTGSIHGSGMYGSNYDPDEERQYFGQNQQQKLFQSVPQLRIYTENMDSPAGGLPSNYNGMSRFGMVRNVSTTLTESIRAAAAQEARQLNLHRRNSGSKGPAALEHLRGTQQHHQQNSSYVRGSNGSWASRQQQQVRHPQSQFHQKQYGHEQPHYQSHEPTVEERQQELFQFRFKSRSMNSSPRQSPEAQDSNDELSRKKEEKRLSIEQMIRECRGTGLNFCARDADGVET